MKPRVSAGRRPQLIHEGMTHKLEERLDSFEGLGDEQFVEVNNIVLGLQKQKQFAKVTLALSKDLVYEEWWGHVLEWR